MNVKNKEQAKQQTEMLVELRKQHSERAKVAQELLRAQQQVRKTLQRAMRSAPRSVPQLAEQTGISAHEVLWHIAAMKKYGLIEETGMDEAGEYYLYGPSKEAKA
jgi:predicted transcriptional regulator